MCLTYEVYILVLAKTMQRQSLWNNLEAKTFNCWFKTSSDKLQNAGQSVSHSQQSWNTV